LPRLKRLCKKRSWDSKAANPSDAAPAEKMRRIRHHGQQGRYHHTALGLNSRLDTLQAVVLLAKLECFDTELKSRTRIANRYTELLRGHVATPHVDPCCTSVYAQYTVQLEKRDQVQARLRERGVPSAVHYPLPTCSRSSPDWGWRAEPFRYRKRRPIEFSACRCTHIY